MSLNTTLGRRPFVYVEIDLDYCPLTYGTAPCTANPAATKCYNTLKTCKALAAYATAMATPARKTYRFGSADQLVRGGDDMIPSVRSVKFAPTKIEDQGGLGARAAVSIALMDTTHNDVNVDKYVDTRGQNMLNNGTFWSRLLARNPYYISRPLRLYTGFLGADETVASGEFNVQYYVMESISGPDAMGHVSITAKDVLNLVDDDRAKIPAIRSGYLNVACTSASMTLFIKDSDYTTYPGSGFLVIDNEVIKYAGVVGTAPNDITMTVVSRGVFGTIAAAHSVDAKVQPGYAFDVAGGPVRIDAALIALLNAAGVPNSRIDIASWTVEANRWCDAVRLYGIVCAPTGSRTLIRDVCKQANVYIWYDTRSQLVKFRVNRPALGDEITYVNDDIHILEGSFKQSAVAAKRLSRVFYYYGIIDPTQKPTEPSNYRGQYVQVDGQAESTLGYGAEQTLKIFAPYFRLADINIVANMAARLLKKFRNPPQQFTFNLDAKDRALWTGNFIGITARNVIGPDGKPVSITAEIIQAQENRDGDQLAMMAQSTQSGERYAIIMANGSSDYNSSLIRDPAGFIGTDPQSSSTMPNGDAPYLMS